ncbi:hypothetical protein SRIMM317S_01398 [Streptomyces rimosus subsp. rimosus]
MIAPDGHSIGFKDVGERALATLARLAADRSVYVDPKPGSEQMHQVFIGGRMGMMATGPWELPDIVAGKVDYDVVAPPTYSGRPCTISGPDTWTVFDNGPARSGAAVEFLRWLGDPAQDVRWAVNGGSLPLSTAMARRPEWRGYEADDRAAGVHHRAEHRAGPARPPGVSAHFAGGRRSDRRRAAGPQLPRRGAGAPVPRRPTRRC